MKDVDPSEIVGKTLRTNRFACDFFWKCRKGDVLARARILLADDHDDFLKAARGLLESSFEVVGAVKNGRAVIDAASKLCPDILVLDISMPVMNGLDAVRHLRAAGLQSKIILLTVHEDHDYVRSGMLAGAQGYVAKSRLVSDLPVALIEVLAGRTFVSPFNSSTLEPTVARSAAPQAS